MSERDLLGRPVSESDAAAVTYLSRTEDACRPLRISPPCVERNVKKALACMWQVVNDLDLEFEQLYDLGV